MTDAELSRELALAIGYAPENTWMEGGSRSFMVRGTWDRYTYEYWRKFDYRDPSVCLPLIKWLMVEHDVQAIQYSNVFHFWISGQGTIAEADTLEEAVCKAVIAVGRK